MPIRTCRNLAEAWPKRGGGVHLSALTYAGYCAGSIGTCHGREAGPNFAGAAALFVQRSRFVRTSFSYDGEVHRAVL